MQLFSFKQFLALLQGRIAAKDVVVKERGAVYASSSQHHDIMAGQGTMCTELLQQVDCLPRKISWNHARVLLQACMLCF